MVGRLSLSPVAFPTACTHLRYFSSTARAEVLINYKFEVAGFGRTTLQFTTNSVVELKAAIIAKRKLGLEPERLKLYVVNGQKKEEDLETLEEQLEEGAFLNFSNLPSDYRIARNNPMVVRIAPSITIPSASSTSISPAAIITKRGSDFYANPPKRAKFNKFPMHSISDFKTLVQEGYYLYQLLAGDPLVLVDANHKMNDAILHFVASQPGSSVLLADLIVKGETEIDSNSIHSRFRLADFAETDSHLVKSFLFYMGALTFSDKEGLLCVPNLVVRKTIMERVNKIWKIDIESHSFKSASNELLMEGNIDLLCQYLEGKMKLIQRGNLGDHNELVTKAMFVSSLSAIRGLRGASEVPVLKTDRRGQKGTGKVGYIDLLTIESKLGHGFFLNIH